MIWQTDMPPPIPPKKTNGLITTGFFIPGLLSHYTTKMKNALDSRFSLIPLYYTVDRMANFEENFLERLVRSL